MLTVVGAQLVQFKPLTKYIAGVFAYRRKRCVRKFSTNEKKAKCLQHLSSKPEWEAPHRWEDAIKMGFQLIGYTPWPTVRPIWTR
jgi:hypothetical protein